MITTYIEVLAALSVTVLSIYWAMREAVKSKSVNAITNALLIGNPLTLIDISLTPITALIIALQFVFVTARVAPIPHMHILNITVLLFITLYTQIVRTYSVWTGRFSQFRSYVYTINSGVVYFTYYLFAYNALFSENRGVRVVAAFIAVANVFRVIGYRVRYDFPAAKDDGQGLTLHRLFIVLIVDVAASSLISIIMSFSLSCMLLLGPSTMRVLAPIHDFQVRNTSGDTFFDFLYFASVSLTTVGYGDIVPVSVPAKAITMCFIALGYLVIATVLAMGGAFVVNGRSNSQLD